VDQLIGYGLLILAAIGVIGMLVSIAKRIVASLRRQQ
jgi:hypothetical protein